MPQGRKPEIIDDSTPEIPYAYLKELVQLNERQVQMFTAQKEEREDRKQFQAQTKLDQKEFFAEIRNELGKFSGEMSEVKSLLSGVDGRPGMTERMNQVESTLAENRKRIGEQEAAALAAKTKAEAHEAELAREKKDDRKWFRRLAVTTIISAVVAVAMAVFNYSLATPATAPPTALPATRP